MHIQQQETLERWRQQRSNSRSRTAASIRRKRNRVAPLPQKNETQKRIHSAWQHAQEQVLIVNTTVILWPCCHNSLQMKQTLHLVSVCLVLLLLPPIYPCPQ